MWMAPRGIVAASVASVFSFGLVEAGVEGAEELAAITFLVIVGTVSFYGLTAGPVARRLGLAERNPQGVVIAGAHPLARAIACALCDQGITARLLDTNWENVRAGREEGLEVFHGSAYSEEVLERLDLTGIGRMLAMTPNDEVNSLAALQFPEVFSRAEVYQLPPRTGNGDGRELSPAPQHLTGRILFGRTFNYRFLDEQLQRGAEIRAIPLTTEFTYADLQAEYGGRLIPLFVVSARKKLTILTTDNQVTPQPGQTIISMVLPESALEDEETARRVQAVRVDGA